MSSDLNDHYYEDGVDDVLAAYVNRLLASSQRSEYQNAEVLAADRLLLDADTPLQLLDGDGANWNVTLPVADLDENHPFLIVNTSSGSELLSILSNDETVTHAVLCSGEYLFLLPDGVGTYVTIGKLFGKVVSPSQITANQNNYNPSGAGSADVLRINTDASRDITGFAFPANYKTLLVHNVGSYNIVLKDESASSTAANRFALSGDATLSPDQSVLLWYDATSSRWRLVGGGGSSGGSGSATNGWNSGTGTWSYVSADSPSFVVDVPDADAALFSVGARLSLTQTTEKFFIVTAKGSPSGGHTPCTIYGGTDYTLANSAITVPKWSNIKVPYGFPLDKAKWTVKATHNSNTTQSSPTANTWYNVTSISLPIGAWDVDYKCAAYAIRNSTAIEQFVTLSTANNSESDNELTCWILNQGASSTTLGVLNGLFTQKQISVAAKTSYYLNMRTTQSSVTSIAVRGDVAITVLRAVCAYL